MIRASAQHRLDFEGFDNRSLLTGYLAEKQTNNNDLLEKDGGTEKIVAYSRINVLAFKVSSVHISTAVKSPHYNKLD